MMAPVADSSSVLIRLRKAVHKVRFMLSSNLTHWLFMGSTAAAPTRRLSFKDQPGLLDFAAAKNDDFSHDAVFSPPAGVISRASSGIGRTMSSTWKEIMRTLSSSSDSSSSPVSRNASEAASSSPEDINRRADAFIENFYRQLRMERQVSLQLRYCNKSGELVLERTKSDD